MNVIAFLDEQGNVRPPKTWDEVKEQICNQWDSCSPCLYAGGPSRTGGGFECNHPMNPYNHVRVEKLGIIHNGMSRLVDDIEAKLKEI